MSWARQRVSLLVDMALGWILGRVDRINAETCTITQSTGPVTRRSAEVQCHKGVACREVSKKCGLNVGVPMHQKQGKQCSWQVSA